MSHQAPHGDQGFAPPGPVPPSSFGAAPSALGADPRFGTPTTPAGGFPGTTRAYVPPPRGGQGQRWLIVATAVAIVLVLVGTVVVTRSRNAQKDAAVPVSAPPMDLHAAGYTTFTGPRGLPLAVGSPWGTRCAPLVLTLDSKAPLALVSAASEVATEATGDGLNVVYGDTSGTYDVSQLRNVAADGTGVHAITVRTTTATAPKLPSGKLQVDAIGWSASLAPDKQHEQLTKVVVTVYLRTVGSNGVLARGAMRKAVAWALGISGSTHVGSGLYTDRSHRADLFTDNDVVALRAASGCD